MGEDARPIKTLDDVRRILMSANASPIELLECANIAQQFGDNSLRRQAAERFFEIIKTSRRRSDLDVLRAAEHVIYSRFREANDLQSLKLYIDEMINWLENLRSSGIDSKRLNELQETLSQALVLSANPDDRSRIELCSKLRSLECSNIALVVVEPVIQANPKNLVALTTYAAAHIDIDEAEIAYTLLLPWASTQPTNYHSLVTLSRACENLGRYQEAHHYARNAFNSNQNIYTAHRLLKSAAEVEDHLAFEEALTSVDSFLDSQRKLESRNVLLLSAEELVNGNRVDAALLTISSLLSSRFNWKGKDAKRIGKLRRWRDDQLQGRLE